MMIELLYQLQESKNLGYKTKSIDEVISTIGNVGSKFEHLGLVYVLDSVEEELITSSRLIGYRVVVSATTLLNDKPKRIKFYESDIIGIKKL